MHKGQVLSGFYAALPRVTSWLNQKERKRQNRLQENQHGLARWRGTWRIHGAFWMNFKAGWP